MAVFLNNNVGVKISTVDLSDHVTAVTLNRTFDELEVTAMGDGGHKFVKGLEAFVFYHPSAFVALVVVVVADHHPTNH